ncbi:hypothetical protein, partial [Sphingobacterium sp.]|uniref:hypothetical protein n=1 Tax=Sphingobacterium sp. TaxID=341027 RepID=UPI0028A2749C
MMQHVYIMLNYFFAFGKKQYFIIVVHRVESSKTHLTGVSNVQTTDRRCRYGSDGAQPGAE